jgi:succinate dehydrogenase (ubiquinone) cytochrome b560 subunit
VGLTNDQDFFEKNEKMHRPMSPHLTIYKFPLPAIMSISHRGSGIALTGAICAAGIGLMVHPLAFYVDAAQARHQTLGITLYRPFGYHYTDHTTRL